MGMYVSKFTTLAQVTRSDPAATVFRLRWLLNLTSAGSVDSIYGIKR